MQVTPSSERLSQLVSAARFPLMMLVVLPPPLWYLRDLIFLCTLIGPAHLLHLPLARS